METQGNELLELGFELPAGATIYRAKGCPGCRHTGYVGRTGVFELVTFDAALRDGLQKGLSDPELFALARANRAKTFREDGAAKILLGLTSVEEIVQLS
jgi:type II secretory ATPase GspE/PulE/Tfp pilus assembly ATPase PilB-like protein